VADGIDHLRTGFEVELISIKKIKFVLHILCEIWRKVTTSFAINKKKATFYTFFICQMLYAKAICSEQSWSKAAGGKPTIL
jgi:hypothetical protein